MMKDTGIKEIARKVEEFADAHLMGQRCCAAVVDNEIVLCVKDEPAYFLTGAKFDVDTPRMLIAVGTNIINRMAFNLGPDETYEIIESTKPKPRVHQRKRLELAFSV